MRIKYLQQKKNKKFDYFKFKSTQRRRRKTEQKEVSHEKRHPRVSETNVRTWSKETSKTNIRRNLSNCSNTNQTQDSYLLSKLESTRRCQNKHDNENSNKKKVIDLIRLKHR